MKSKGKITQGTKIHMCSEYLEKFKFQNQKCPKFIQSICLQWQSCETVLMGYINTDNQVVTFLWSLVLGVAMCLAYDVVRAFHKVSVKGFFEVMLLDLLFWGTWSLITFSFLVLRCKGEVRAYVLFGQAVGFIITRISVSKLFYHIFTLVLKVFRRIFEFFG